MAQKENSSVIDLPEVFDEHSISEIKDMLSKVVGNGSLILVSGSDVSSLSLECIQLMVSVQKKLDEVSGVFSVQDPSEVMEQVFRDCGLESTLEEWRQ